MPCLAIPFSDTETCKRLKEVFKVRGIPNLVIFDAHGKVSCDGGVRTIRNMVWMDIHSPLITLDKLINFLKEQEEDAKRNQTISSVLVSSSRDYMISKDGSKVDGLFNQLVLILN